MKLKLTNTIITIVGKKRTGKTTHIKEILLNGHYDQIFVLDRLYDFRKFGNICSVSFDEVTIKQFCEDVVWEKCDTRIKSVAIFDEVHLYGKNDKDVDFIYRCAGHANLDLIATSQRFKELPPIIRSQTNEFHVFNVTEPLDLDYLKDYVSPKVVDTISRLQVLQYVKLHI